MADTKISALTAVTTPVTTDEFAVNQGGTSKKVTLQQLWATHISTIQSDFTGANSAVVQPIFPTTQDVLTVAGSTTYLWDLYLQVTMGATTCTMALAFDAGTCTYTAMRYWAMGAVNVADNATGTAQSTICVNTAAATVITATGTGTGKWIVANGIMRINAGGTFIPQFKFSADPTGTVLVKVGTYMKVTPIGAGSMTFVGDWA